MFILINKEKLKTYFITIGTVAILFVITATTNINSIENSVQTSIYEYKNEINNITDKDTNSLKIEDKIENNL